MNEQRAAEALARWLDHPGGDPPADVEPDVLEAVYALRPELAPPPRVSIEDVLAELGEGPLAEEPAAGERLARWLEHEEIPEDADDPALEAVWALRPELAPPPRVSIEDVLGELRAGPLAGSTQTQPEHGQPEHTLPASLGELPEPVEVANRVPARSRRLPAWFLPGAGALLMAALALLVVLPASERAPRGFPEPAAPQASSVAEVARPEPTVAPERRTQALQSPELARSAPAPRPAEQEAPARERDGWGDAGEGARADADLAPAASAPATGAPSPVMAEVVGGAVAEVSPTPQAEAASAAQGSWGYLADEAPAPVEEKQAAAPMDAVYGEAGGGGLGAADDRVAELEEVVTTAPAAKRAASRQAAREELAKPKSSAGATRSLAPAVASGPDPAEASQLALADRLIEAGDARNAERVLLSLLDSIDTSIVKGAALRLGRLYRDQGRPAEARAVLERGIAAGEAPAELQAELRALLAEL